MHQLTLLFVLYLCTCGPASFFSELLAQNPLAVNAEQLISGVIIDAKDGSPLPYVNVFLASNQSRGVLTNEKGEFSIPLTEADRDDQLVVSLLSYLTHTETVADILDQGFFNHRMTSSFVSLGEVVVISDLGLSKLMEQVFARIPDNYGTNHFTLHAYARSYQIDDGRYSQFAEAIVNVSDRKYGLRDKQRKQFKPQFRATHFRMERDTVPSLRDRWRVMSHQWKLVGFYNGNVARRGNYRHLRRGTDPAGKTSLKYRDLTFLQTMEFSNRGEYLDGEDTLIRIGYQPSPSFYSNYGQPGGLNEKTMEEDWWHRGEFLINKNDLAIVRYTQGDGKRGFFEDIVYQKIGGKYFLKQLTWYLEIEYEGDTRQFIDHQTLYVTGVTTGKKEARKAMKGKLLIQSDDLADLRVKYDANFWRNNRFLQTLNAPEEMRLSMERIQRSVEERHEVQERRDSL